MRSRDLVFPLASVALAFWACAATTPAPGSSAADLESGGSPSTKATEAARGGAAAPASGLPESAPAESGDDAPALPTLARWYTHVTRELLPFWLHPDALGTPAGNFPTFRCNDGTAYRAEAPCPELAMLSWVRAELGTEYTRMKSRQTFVYGVGYHLTGDERLLARARDGVAYLRRHAYEADTGSAVSYWRDGAAGPPPGQRTTQDLAYAQLGLAFYYYLTRDPEVLADLVRLEAHIFSTYYEPSWGMLRWVVEEGEAGSPAQQELVAQLDQINAYLLLVAPLLDEPLRGRWLGHMHMLAQVIAERFFAPAHGLFWGAIHEPARMQLGSHHTDFGHSIKALLMLYQTGKVVGDEALVGFAERHADALIARAFRASAGPDGPTGCWASNLLPEGRVDRWSTWWTAAELDQAVATLALGDRSRGRTHERYLRRSYACWLERFVDPEGGEVWLAVPPPGWTGEEGDGSDVRPPKVFHWKSGYHSMEHALIALITTAGLTGEPLALYYAFRQVPAPERIRPYVFDGVIAEESAHPLPSFPALHGRRVVFRDIR